MLDEIKEEIKTYESYINEINKLNKNLKDLKIKKEKEEKKLIKLFERNNLTNNIITTNTYHIEYSLRKSRQSFSKEFLKNCLIKYFQRSNVNLNVNEIINFIYNSREISEKKIIKSKLIN